jgi:hypothetical protein
MSPNLPARPATVELVCMSVAPAVFSGTTLYAGRKHHPTLGEIEVLGYQNEARNLARTPNAMVLHVPARLTQDNFISLGEYSNVLKNMVDLISPPLSRGWGSGYGSAQGAAAPPVVHIFEHDIYTVLLAEDPTQIPAALDRVPPHKRPPLDPALFQFYAQAFPNHSIVLCCFDNAESSRAKPLMLWYPPTYPDWVVLPALDGHTGGVPDVHGTVMTDHWLVFGSDDAPEGWGTPTNFDVNYEPGLSEFLPTAVQGLNYTGQAPNGDFAIPYSDLLSGQVNRSTIQRLQPAWRPS